ncbi:hypothetical protein T484DRAFT_1778131 [Baffinella frigidus]|nr:hypothetical protein T484DRAFT_1778131 [Cryptophyta sp. CCMP2293]
MDGEEGEHDKLLFRLARLLQESGLEGDLQPQGLAHLATLFAKGGQMTQDRVLQQGLAHLATLFAKGGRMTQDRGDLQPQGLAHLATLFAKGGQMTQDRRLAACLTQAIGRFDAQTLAQYPQALASIAAALTTAKSTDTALHATALASIAAALTTYRQALASIAAALTTAKSTDTALHATLAAAVPHIQPKFLTSKVLVQLADSFRNLDALAPPQALPTLASARSGTSTPSPRRKPSRLSPL